MKKMLCLVLVVLTMLALFTGCSGRVYSDYGGGNAGRTGSMFGNGNVSTGRDGTENGRGNAGRTGGMFSNGNVSTSRDGTVNGGEWNGRNYRSDAGTNSNARKHGQRMDIGAELEIGK